MNMPYGYVTKQPYYVILLILTLGILQCSGYGIRHEYAKIKIMHVCVT